MALMDFQLPLARQKMLRRPIIYYIDGRLHEWVMAVAMVLFGTAMLIWPRMIHGSILQFLAQYVGGLATALIFIMIGTASLGALIANGSSWTIGPRVRSLCAIARSVLWCEFTLSMLKVSVEQGFPSPMVFFFGTFTIAELYIAYRAVLDVRTS